MIEDRCLGDTPTIRQIEQAAPASPITIISLSHHIQKRDTERNSSDGRETEPNVGKASLINTQAVYRLICAIKVDISVSFATCSEKMQLEAHN